MNAVGRRILLVASESEERRRLVARLSRGSYRVEACACPREAELRLAAATIALVDLSSHAVDGVNLIQTLSRRRPDLPIVALGSRADSPGAIAAIRAGARGCLFVDDTSHRLLLAMDEASAGGRPMSRGMGALLFDHVHGSGRREVDPDFRTGG